MIVVSYFESLNLTVEKIRNQITPKGSPRVAQPTEELLLFQEGIPEEFEQPYN